MQNAAVRIDRTPPDERRRRTECFCLFNQIPVPGYSARRLGMIDPAKLKPAQCRAALDMMHRVAWSRHFDLDDLLAQADFPDDWPAELAMHSWRAVVRALATRAQ